MNPLHDVEIGKEVPRMINAIVKYQKVQGTNMNWIKNRFNQTR